MTERELDYLWTGEAPADPNITAIERELEPLRWQPRPLSMPTSLTVLTAQREHPIQAPTHAPRSLAPRSGGWRRSGRWMPALAAGAAAAAAVFVTVFWLRAVPLSSDASAPASAPSPAPTLSPAAPSSPELKDPFSNSGAPHKPGSTPPVREQDGQQDAPEAVTPTLKDPFADGVDPRSQLQPEPRINPDLKDPFAGSDTSPEGGDRFETRAPKQQPPTYVDPFSGQAPAKQPVSPNLKNPFSN